MTDRDKRWLIIIAILLWLFWPRAKAGEQVTSTIRYDLPAGESDWLSDTDQPMNEEEASCPCG